MRLVSSIRGLSLALSAGLFCVSPILAVTPETPAPQLGKQIEDFKLRDYRGKERSLKEFDGKPVAIVFIGSDCPLAKLYAPRLEQIFQQYKSQGVGVVAINSNVQDSLEKVGAYARIHKVTFPVLKDPDNQVADLFDAQRTPHAYVLDADRVVRYVGRIDDQYGLGATSGYAKPELEHSYITDAIEDLLHGNQVRIASTKATGCIIGRKPEVSPHGEITYSNQVSRILNNRCVSCHRDGEVAPFPLTDYDEVNGWGEMMLEVIDKGQMPPWFANPEYGPYKNDCRLSQDEKDTLQTWVDNGSPEGDPSDLPEPPKFADGWQIGVPDQIVELRRGMAVVDRRPGRSNTLGNIFNHAANQQARRSI
jgi:peroxiredoxin